MTGKRRQATPHKLRNGDWGAWLPLTTKRPERGEKICVNRRNGGYSMERVAKVLFQCDEGFLVSLQEKLR